MLRLHLKLLCIVMINIRKAGHRISANLDAVAPVNAAVSYQWTVDGKVVSTANSHTLKKSDVRKKLILIISGKSGYIGSLSKLIVIK
jgi:hypothetical protein